MSDLSPGGAHRGKHGARVMGNPWNRAGLLALVTFEQQADAVIAQANPVAGTSYPVLAVNANVRIISIAARVTWTVQPALAVDVTIDGNTVTYAIGAPVSTAVYCSDRVPFNAANAQELVAVGAGAQDEYAAFILEGRSVVVSARTVGGTSSLLDVRVKWARRD